MLSLGAASLRRSTNALRSLSQGQFLSVRNSSHLIITASGPDRPGIVADFTKAVLDQNGSIAESKAVRMGGDFCIMMRILANQSGVTQMEDLKRSLSSVPNMAVDLREASPDKFGSLGTEPVCKTSFTLEGADHPGIVNAVTSFLCDKGFSIEELHTEAKSAPFGGTMLFLMNGKASSNVSQNFDELREGFKVLENQLNVDLLISQI
uniref:ACT domain-containing protein n=1 Tax=Fibrocapsa japonica TaxID=94617 RepID=A0A7S2UU75_9STRA